VLVVRIERNGNDMSVVRYKQGELPPLTQERKAALKALAAGPDGGIDYGELLPLDDGFWKNAVRNPFYKPTQTSTTLRVDSDVLAWLKSQGKGYRSRINAILRDAMLHSIR
jgi:uncharacterized protein (DUF4415 family)